MLGLAASLAKGGASLLTYVKDNLKLYLDFKSNRSDTLAFVSEGSTSFDGDDDKIELGSIASSNPLSLSGSNGTISVWIYVPDVSDGDDHKRIVSKSNGGSGTNGYDFVVRTDGLVYGYINGSGILNSDSALVSDAEWVYLTWSWDGTNHKLYKNGILEKTTASTTTPPSVSDINMFIGSWYSTGREFKGKMANVGIWSRALSLEEINSVMNKSYSQLGSVEKTSLVMWQSLDSASNGVVTPASGETLGSDLAPTSWTATNATTSESTDYAHSGTTSRKYITSGTGGHDGIYTSTFTTVQNALYKLDMWVYSPSQGDIFVRIVQGDGSGYSLSEEVTIATGEWVNIVRYFTEIGSSVGSAEFFVGNDVGSAVTQYIDDISIKAVTSNTGLVTGATTTTSVYGGNAPVLPRSVDVARQGEAEAIGDGSALFNGTSDYIDVGADVHDFSAGDFTITAWLYYDYETNHGGVVGIRDGSGTELQLYMQNSTRKLGSYNGTNAVATSNTIPEKEWTHIAVVQSGGDKKFYINGILDNTATQARGTARPVSLRIGDTGHTENEHFKGNISQVGIWAGELTQAQIQSVMEATSYAKLPASVKSTLGSNVLLNGDFASGDLTSWSAVSGGSAMSVVDGSVLHEVGDSGGFRQSVTLTSGALYKGTFDIKSITTGTDSNTTTSWTIYNYAGSSPKVASTKYVVGTNTFYFVPDDNGIWFEFTSSHEFTIDDFTLKPVTNDLAGYWGLDSSSQGVTQDSTTGETLSTLYSEDFSSVSNGTDSITLDSGNFVWDTYGSPTNRDVQDNKLRITTAAGGNNGVKLTPDSLTSSKLYKFSFTSSGSNDNVHSSAFISGIANNSSIGDKEAYITGVTSLIIYFRSGANSGTDGSTTYYDNIKFEEVTSNTGVLL